MLHILSSDFFDFEFLRILGTAPFHGSDVGECLEAGEHIRNNDPESWYKAWTGAAEKAEAQAVEARRTGDVEAARWAFLRASNYRRSSEFLLHHLPHDPRLLRSVEQATANFKQACRLFDSPVIELEIPYGHGTMLPAYLYLPTSFTGDRAPVIVNTGGFDSIQEELYYYTASGARTRGYATLSFEGPGQGLMLRRNKLSLRPDWEVVIAAVLDELFHAAQAHPQWRLDLARIAVLGASMGGYFALRGATDSRVKACVAIDGFYDLGAAVRERIPSPVLTAMERGYVPDAVFNGLFSIMASLNFQTRWEFGHAMLAFGVDSPAAVLREFNRYTLRPAGDAETIVSRIRCPVLVTGSRETLYFRPETSACRIYDGLTQLKEGDEKSLWIPTGVGQGSLQAKVAATAHLHFKAFAWLDQVFGIERNDVDN
ncbi:uncharacterized protein K452DRAFT_237336 [Aplosporella prunicola CBS 121167]|uniref:AB hydrolase-1 domain-containing protein n=1 Tax=Aplosporella prunicola CBS 121167 TaxID=1176127 RepID=A0A6A6AY44_9PEZI|nr:uncharacterized protein K452DRAFT_237336 [Aplosporella prunicola CBS 121167]KAF2136526.1 hypothetical protein K452DRAFT_237336 [Aplosporella prunicola CBS 121167]